MENIPDGQQTARLAAYVMKMNSRVVALPDPILMSANGKSGKTKTPAKAKGKKSPSAPKASGPKRSAQNKVTALGPFMDRPAKVVSDNYRLAEYNDDGTTRAMHSNQILELIQINPRNLANRSRKSQVERGEIPSDIPSAAFAHSYIQYSFSDCRVEVTNILPDTLTGTLGLCVIPDPSAEVNQVNVLDLFNSVRGANGKDSSNAVMIHPGETKSISIPHTGLLFCNNPEGSDIRLSSPGLLCLFVMSPVLAGLSGTEDRSWKKEIAQSRVKFTCKFYNKLVVPTTPGLGGFSTETILRPGSLTKVNTYNKSALTPAESSFPGINVMISPFVAFVGTGQQSAVVATANDQIIHGETESQIDAVGVQKSRRRIARPSFALTSFAESSGVYPVEQLDWSSALNWLESSYNSIVALPGQFQNALYEVFGEETGNIIYNVGKELAMFAFSVLILEDSQSLGPVSEGSDVYWTADGYPISKPLAGVTNAFTNGPFRAGSPAYNWALDVLLGNSGGPAPNPQFVELYQDMVDQGQTLVLMQYTMSGSVKPIEGVVLFNDDVVGGTLETHQGFGQPETLDAIDQIETAPRKITPKYLSDSMLNNRIHPRFSPQPKALQFVMSYNHASARSYLGQMNLSTGVLTPWNHQIAFDYFVSRGWLDEIKESHGGFHRFQFQGNLATLSRVMAAPWTGLEVITGGNAVVTNTFPFVWNFVLNKPDVSGYFTTVPQLRSIVNTSTDQFHDSINCLISNTLFEIVGIPLRSL